MKPHCSFLTALLPVPLAALLCLVSSASADERKPLLVESKRILGGLPVLEWVEIEPSKEEENADAVVVEVPEAAGGGFEGLDGGIECLGHGIGNPMIEILEEAEQVILERERDFLSRLKLAALSPA